MLSITTKIILAYTIVFALMLSLFAYFIYRNVGESEMAKLDARLESHADKIMTELEEDSDEPGFPDRAALDALHTEGLPIVHVQLLTREGVRMIADSAFAGPAGEGWKEARDGVAAKSVISAGGRRVRCLWARSESSARLFYIVEVSAPMTEVEETLERFRVLFLILIPAALIVTALSAYAITRAAFRPIRGMIATAREITAERLDRRLALPNTRDEVHSLGETLNGMIDRIDTSFNSQRQFIADASHEIRTPLTVVTTELEYVVQRLNDPELKESIQVSLAEIDQLSKLADSLLLLAKLDAAQLRLEASDLRLDELLLECIQRVRSISGKKRIEMRVDVRAAVEMRGDKDKLRSVILNLLDNAIKYSPERGIVSAIIGLEGSAATISIADTGIGIPASEFKNIFKRFYRIDPSRGNTSGNGLGLAIVDRLVQLHGGSVRVESQEGTGSTFIVTLPLNPAA